MSTDISSANQGCSVQVLPRYRKPWVAGGLYVVMLCWALEAPVVRGIYVPNFNGDPEWAQLPGESWEPSYPADTADADENGMPDWKDAFYANVANGTLAYWQGGTWVIDGVSTSLGGQWLPGTADNDGDQIPDAVDSYPQDSTNHSFFWTGGTFVSNSVYHTFRSGWYAGSILDHNTNSIPDCLEDWFNTMSTHGVLQQWAGGTIVLNGQSNTYQGPIYYYADSYSDSDGDGLPNEIDPYPSDPWNNISFSWNGGDFYVDGVLTHFNPASFGGTLTDADADTIPDPADPWPQDSANNTAWWLGGGAYLIDGQWQTFGNRYHRANAGDSDADGLPDDIDPMPEDAENQHRFEWGGGWFWIDNQFVQFFGGTYLGIQIDTDGDNIPDIVDPYGSDPTNGTVTASYTWPGGVFWINNTTQTISGGTYEGTWSDQDLDHIPDPADPYPSDNTNNSSTAFYWEGGTFLVDQIPSSYSAGYYPGTKVDTDSDGIPDPVDPYWNDSFNGNIRYTWSGGVFRVNNDDMEIDGGTFLGVWTDTDEDLIPDPADPYPLLRANGNTETTTYTWAGGWFRFDNEDEFFPEANYPGSWADVDRDLIPDPADRYQTSPFNGNTTFEWAGGWFRVNNNPKEFAGGTFLGTLVDDDNDGIPDSLDPYVGDDGNGNTRFYWGGGTFIIRSQSQTFSAGYFYGDWVDTDRDNIPDVVDEFMDDPNNGNPPPPATFFWKGGYFIIDNGQQFFAEGNYEGTWEDPDGDLIPSVVDPYDDDPNNGNDSGDPPTFSWTGGTFYINGNSRTWEEGVYPGTWSDSDGDLIPNSEDPYPSSAANNSAYWEGGSWVIDGQATDFQPRWQAANTPDRDRDGLPDDLDRYPDIFANDWGIGYDWPDVEVEYVINDQSRTFWPGHHDGYWKDTDQDDIPDDLDPWPKDLYNNNDSDGDGIKDSVEAAYPALLNRFDPTDVNAIRADGITYKQAHREGIPLGQLLSLALDSDADGMTDVYEIKNGLNRKLAADALLTPANDYVYNVEKARIGLAPGTPVARQDYAEITGSDLSGVMASHKPLLSIDENDWDGDGISNLDEVVVFRTDSRSPFWKPSVPALIKAMRMNKCSTTTLIHWGHLRNGSGQGGGGEDGDDEDGSTGGTGGNGGGSGGNGNGSNHGGSGNHSAAEAALGVVLYTPLR